MTVSAPILCKKAPQLNAWLHKGNPTHTMYAIMFHISGNAFFPFMMDNWACNARLAYGCRLTKHRNVFFACHMLSLCYLYDLHVCKEGNPMASVGMCGRGKLCIATLAEAND